MRILIFALLVAGCAPAPNADFFECEPGRKLVVCPVGETPSPPQECRSVGSGTTTMEYGDCQ